jgi:hypothetical protein
MLVFIILYILRRYKMNIIIDEYGRIFKEIRKGVYTPIKEK